MTNNDTIGQALNLSPMEIEVIKPEVNLPANKEDKVDDDFNYSRTNLYSVIEQGSKALEQIIDVAQASEHPRAYEVVATIMKTLVDANKELLELSKKKNDIVSAKQKTEEPNIPNTVNNNLFVGSTAELQKMIEGARK